MKLHVDIKESRGGVIVLRDMTKSTNEFIPEDSNETGVGTNNFKYSDTISISVVKYQHSSGEKDIATVFQKHVDMPSEYEKCDTTKIQLPYDGYQLVYYIVLPTLEWLERVCDDERIKNYNHIYVSDGCGVLRYNPETKDAIQVDIDEILQINDVYNEKFYIGTISRVSVEIFSIDKLKQCYIDISKELFKYCPDNCSLLDNNLKFKRDFIWMTLNVLRYYLEDFLYIEAQNLLEQTTGCNSFCQNASINKNKEGGCGCYR